MRMLAVNRDIMIRTASLITAFLFFTAQGARAGDVTLAANAVLNNFLLISAFFLDGLANAAEQLCGRAYGARDRDGFAGAVRLVVGWGFGFAIVVSAVFALFGPSLIDIMSASDEVRHGARDYLRFVIVAPLLGVFAFAYDGVYIGATWARDMRNLMMLSLLAFLSAWFALRGFGNAGLWGALLVHYAARGGLEALRYPALLRASFPNKDVRSLVSRTRCSTKCCSAEPGPMRHRTELCPNDGPRISSASRRSTARCAASGTRCQYLPDRPILGRDRRGIGADDFRQRIAPGPQQGRRQIVLDVVDQAETLVDQRRIKLDQAGAGADLGQRGAAGVDAADADQRKRAFGTHIGLRHHPGRQAETAAARTTRPARSARACSRKVEGRASVVLATIMPSTRRERAMCTTSSSSARLRSGAIFNSTGESPAFCRTRSRASITRASRSSSAAACCRLRRPGVFGDDTLTVK